MKKNMPEFAAIPMVLVGLGIVFLVLWAFDAGAAAWIAVGAIGLVAVVAVAVVAMRKPRGVVASGGLGRFEGGAAPVADGVHRVLVVTDDVCSSHDLQGIVAKGNGTAALVVAPAISSRVARWTGDESAYQEAGRHLEATIDALKGLGLDASGHVGAHDPLQAADDGLREFPADEIVFVLGDGEHWLEQGVVETARERYGVPVRSLTAGRT